MFHNLAVDIAFLLIKNKLVSIEKRDSYIHALEAILLNGSLLAFFLIISLLTKEMINFLSYLIFYIPLRFFAGGYKAEKSERRFVLSALMYSSSIVIVKIFPILYKNLYWEIGGLLSLPVILLLTPLKNENILKKKLSKNQSKVIACLLLVVDTIIFILCCNYNLEIASSEMIFIIMEAILLIIEKCGQYLPDEDD